MDQQSTTRGKPRLDTLKRLFQERAIFQKHQNIQTGTSRVLQNMMEKHLEKMKKFNKDVYYKKPNINK